MREEADGSAERGDAFRTNGFLMHCEKSPNRNQYLRDSEAVLRDRNVSGAKNRKLVVGIRRKKDPVYSKFPKWKDGTNRMGQPHPQRGWGGG